MTENRDAYTSEDLLDLAGAVSRVIPDGAAREFAAWPDGAGAPAVSIATAHWASKKPSDAAAWVAQLPEGKTRCGALIGLILGSEDLRNSDKARQVWIKDLPESRSKKEIQALPNRSTWNGDEAARQILKHISDLKPWD